MEFKNKNKTNKYATPTNITSENDKEKENDPFKRNTRLVHSPEHTPTGRTLALEKRQSTTNTGSAASRSETGVGSAFKILGEQISSLTAMLMENDGKRKSIHQPMREVIGNLGLLYEKASKERFNCSAGEKAFTDECSQTSPWPRTQINRLRRKAAGEAAGSPANKRSKVGGKNKQGPPQPKKTESTDTPTTGTQVKKANEWVEVKRKKKNIKKTRFGRARPDAIVIERKGDISYADILKKFKSDENFKSFDNAVSKIRRTQKGELLIELAKDGAHASDLKEAVSATLGNEVYVKALTHRVSIECKDIDEVTTKEEVYNAVNAIPGLEDLKLSDIASLREAYAGTQTAIISLPAPKAKKLLELGKIRIGWVVCRIRERVQVQKCFKCLQYGHMSRNCASTVDRSKQCRKCGTEGHFAKDCKNSPQCMLCKADQRSNIDHVAGSYRCPVFKKALTNRR